MNSKNRVKEGLTGGHLRRARTKLPRVSGRFRPSLRGSIESDGNLGPVGAKQGLRLRADSERLTVLVGL
jgi:hypothetical protein